MIRTVLAGFVGVMALSAVSCKNEPESTHSGASPSGSPPSAAAPPIAALASAAALVASVMPGATAAPGASTTAPNAVVPSAVGKLVGSCSIMGMACSDYYGSSGAEAKKVCTSVGKWSDGPCPTAGVQGTCTKVEPGGLVNKTHSYAPGTPESAKKACGNTPGGVFSAR